MAVQRAFRELKRYFWPDAGNDVGFESARARLVCSFSGVVAALSILHILHLALVVPDLTVLFWIFAVVCAGVFLISPAIWHRTENAKLTTLVLVSVFLAFQNVLIVLDESHLLRQELFLLGAPVLVLLLTGARFGAVATFVVAANIFALSLLEQAFPFGEAVTIVFAMIAVSVGLTVFHAEVLRKERILIDLREAAELATKEKSEFVAKMSHEIRTPLNGLSGVLQLLEETNLTEDQRLLIETGRASGNNLMSLVNDVLDYSTISAKGITIKPSETTAEQLFSLVRQTQEPLARDKGICLLFKQGTDLPSCLLVDSLRVNQVLTNLVSNAIKFSEKGTILCKLEKQGGRLRFSVADEGIGLTKDAQARIFDKFEQAHSNINRQFGGTGLGLAICKELVTLMGGRIGVDSQPQKGSTFWFTLPLKEGIASETPTQSGTIPEALPAMAGVKALLVEDNRTNQLIARRFLESMGVDVEIVDDGLPALEACRDRHFDVILMDIHLPQLDGVETTRRLREMPGANQNTPVVALSANIFEEQTSSYLSAGMNICVGKPYKKQQLAQAISSLCSYEPLSGSVA